MPIDSVKTGANERQIVVLGDPLTASNQQAVQPASSDAMSVSGLFGSLTDSVQLLINSSGLADRMRSAVGTTGIAAVNSEGTKASYSVGIVGFTPAATPTDILGITGSGTKTVRLTRIVIAGIATAAATVEIQLIKRSSASTGGSPTTPTIVAHDSNDASATAVVNQYTANPTTGTLVGTLRAEKLNLGAAGAAGRIVWDFTTRNSKGLVLRGAAQSLNLNWGGAAVPSGTSLTIDVEFTEE
jgi:hypothetical protein